MRRLKLHNEMIDIDGNGYIKADVLVTNENSNEGHARIPGLGRVLVYKKIIQCYIAQTMQSFAWYVKES